jgi:hypothetical protein
MLQSDDARVYANAACRLDVAIKAAKSGSGVACIISELKSIASDFGLVEELATSCDTPPIAFPPTEHSDHSNVLKIDEDTSNNLRTVKKSGSVKAFASLLQG